MRDDRGESLVELLAALVVLSIGVVALLTALGTHVSTTTINRSHSQAATLQLAAAEHVKALPLNDSDDDGGIDSCSQLEDADVTVAELPHDPLFAISYGPAERLDGSACQAGDKLAVVPVRVVGDGFSLELRVVKRP